MSISDLRSNEGFNWCSKLPLSTEVKLYSGVMAHNGMLVNVDDNVSFKSKESEKVPLQNNN